MEKELEYWLRLNNIENLGIKAKLDLITNFGDPEEVFEADLSQLVKHGVSVSQYEAYHSEENKRAAERIMESCERLNIKILTLTHDEYPEMLKYIADPPLVLYARGNVSASSAIAVVGSRKASGYGIETAFKLSSELSGAGLIIVSGLARGIDTAAHCGALNADGKTIAVLGCGLDTAYPPENKALMERIVHSGAVVSEYPPGCPPAAYNFPNRNRIISGISLGTIVVEAGMKSGSLITANYALEQGREVFAVPGNITNYNSMGTNRLIRDGAKLVLDVNDILDELSFGFTSMKTGSRKKSGKETTGIGSEEKKVLSALKIEDLYDEEISSKTGIPLQDLFTILLDLEIKGLVKKSLTGKYMRIP